MEQNLEPKGDPVARWRIVYEKYRSLFELSRRINLLYSSISTCFLLETVTYYATTFDEVFEGVQGYRDGSRMARLFLYFFLNACAILLVSANVCHKMNTFIMWVMDDENRVGIPVKQYLLVCSELNTQSVSIKWGDISAISYSLIANIVSVMITYFTICVQARVPIT